MVLEAQKQDTVPRTIPRILVLLATYNGAPWLVEQVDSILAQEGVEVSLLIGDDLSKDGTRKLIEETWGNDARIRLHVWEQPSGSAGANFRRLYRLADPAGFDLVALADQDDIWNPDKLQLAAELLARHDAAGYSCSVQSFWPDGRTRTMAQRPITNQGDFLFEGAGQGCTFVVTAALFMRVRAFCGSHITAVEALHYHDWLIYLLSRAWHMRWCFDPNPNMHYRQHDGNEIGSRGGLASITKRLALVRNGWYRKQVLAAAEIYRLANAGRSAVTALTMTLNAPDSFDRRMKIAWFCIRNGRRRLSDRGVLVVSALAGWL